MLAILVSCSALLFAFPVSVSMDTVEGVGLVVRSLSGVWLLV